MMMGPNFKADTTTANVQSAMTVLFEAPISVAAVTLTLVIASLVAFVIRFLKSQTRPKRRVRKKSNVPISAVPVDSILYRPSHPNCDDEYDVIVIGSGIGGLTTASLLAQRNFKVLVLEQHIICGGCCHAFKSGGYRFGTGIHYVGGVGGPGLAKSVLNTITYEDDPLQWDPLAINFDTLVLGTPPSDARRYEFVSGGLRAQKQHLKDQFPPEDHAAIDEYYNLVLAATKSWRNAIAIKCLPLWLTRLLTRSGLYRLLDGGMHKYAAMTIVDVVNSLTDNAHLQAAMCYNWGDHGCEPTKAPWVIQAGLVSHYADGGYYPRGGPGTIAHKIIPTIFGQRRKRLGECTREGNYTSPRTSHRY